MLFACKPNSVYRQQVHVLVNGSCLLHVPGASCTRHRRIFF